MIGKAVLKTNPHWHLLLKLKQCMDYICVPIVTVGIAIELSHIVQENLERFQELYPDERTKLKQHNMLHYPDQILEYGPLKTTWTMKFEAKHLYLKRILQAANNFKNPFKTISMKHALKMIMCHLVKRMTLKVSKFLYVWKRMYVHLMIALHNN